MMDDMGIFRTEVVVENPLRPGVLRTVRDVIVDTGSELTWLSGATLAGLNVHVDPVTKRLVPAGPVLVATAA